MARPSQSSLLLALALAGGGMVLLVPLCAERPAAPHRVSLHQAPPALSDIDLSELDNIERDPINIPDAEITGIEGDWIVPGVEAPPEPAAARPPEASEPPEAREDPESVMASGAPPDLTARYLRDVEYALMSGKYWSSPDALAQTLIAEMSTGQTGGLATLRQSNAAVLARLQAITPPPGCADHHAEMLATVAASVAMLQSWEAMLEAGDLAGFATIASDAEALQARAAQVEALRTACRG